MQRAQFTVGLLPSTWIPMHVEHHSNFITSEHRSVTRVPTAERLKAPYCTMLAGGWQVTQQNRIWHCPQDRAHVQPMLL